MKHSPTPQQLAYYAASADPRGGSVALNAKAGTGKTSTQRELASRLPGSGLATSVLRTTVSDLAKAMPSNWDTKGLHSLGYAAIRKKFPAAKVDSKGNILYEFVKETLKDDDTWWKLLPEIKKLVEQAMLAGIVPKHERFITPDNYEEWETLADRFDIDITPQIYEVAHAALLHLNKQALAGNIQFTHMLTIPLFFNLPVQQYPKIIIDEAQDLNKLQHMMIHKALRHKGRAFITGDPCQPAGTMVTRVDQLYRGPVPATTSQIPIEQIKVGDTILGFARGKSYFKYDVKVLGITKREYVGPLIEVSTESTTTRYTPNHICYASFTKLRNHYAVYLMERNGCFRIGRCKMDYGSSPGPAIRASSENAEKMWILTVSSDSSDAAMIEAYLQAEFGIPDLTFKCPDVNNQSGCAFATQEFLDTFWGLFDKQSLKTKALYLLEAMGRDYQYPIWERGKGNFMLKRMTLIRACNLVSGCTLIPYKGSSESRLKYHAEIKVSRVNYEGFVYSFSVSDDQLYVADNLVTHNCQAIMAFSGADANSFANLVQSFDATILPLTWCWRCGSAIIHEANQYVPELEAPPGAHEGAVLQADYIDLESLPRTIICRNNAPLLALAMRLFAAGFSVECAGRDIGAGLKSTINRVASGKTSDQMQTSEFLSRLHRWAEREVTRRPARKHSVADKQAALVALAEHHRTVGDMRKHIEKLYVNEDDGTRKPAEFQLATVHKAKGREWDQVGFLDAHLLPAKWAKQDWEHVQEKNLAYVAVTRAKQELVYLNSEMIQ